MVDWLHCNTCFKQPGDGTTYYLTSCGHIYCEVCSGKGESEILMNRHNQLLLTQFECLSRQNAQN